MNIIAHHFYNPFVDYKTSYPDSALGETEIKKMITTGMLRQQVQMTDDDELDHILKNSQKLLKLNAQHENQ